MPVVAVKRTLENLPKEETLEVCLDPGAPVANVTRFALNRGYKVMDMATEGGVLLSISVDDQNIFPASGEPPSLSAKTGPSRARGGRLILITSDRIGDGPEELGRLLMKNFVITLLDLEDLPDKMLFLNSGVLLTTEGSELLDVLTELGNRGVEVLSCGVCLDFFNRKDALQAGAVTNMFTIAESLQQAISVVRL